MSLRGKKPRRIRRQTAKRRAGSAVHELALLVALFQKVGIADLKVGKATKERLFRDISEERGEFAQLLPATGLGPGGQIAPHDGLLMEQAELDGRAGQQASYQRNDALSAIYGDAGESPPLRDQVAQTGLDDRQRLARNLLPIDVVPRRAIDHQSIAATEEGGIEGQRDRDG